MSTFDLEPYRAQAEGWFPTQYTAALAWLAVSVVLGFIICTLLTKWAHNKGKPFPPWAFIPAWMVLFAIGAAAFYVVDSTASLPRLYTYTYYKPAVNTDLRDWVNDRYDLDLTTAQATPLKYHEIGSLPFRPSIEYPTVEVPGVGRVKLEPIRKDGGYGGLVLKGVGYEKDGKTVELPRR